PDDLMEGHIDQLAARAVSKGMNVFNVLKAACINPINHYKLNVGQLRIGDPADFIIVKDLSKFQVLQTYINGALVAENGISKIPYLKSEIVNNFNCTPKHPRDFKISAKNKSKIKVIVPEGGQLVTMEQIEKARIENGFVTSNLAADTLKITVINRYSDAPPAVAFIKNFGLQKGAIASCVGHDSHNIIAVGVDDESISHIVN